MMEEGCIIVTVPVDLREERKRLHLNGWTAKLRKRKPGPRLPHNGRGEDINKMRFRRRMKMRKGALLWSRFGSLPRW